MKHNQGKSRAGAVRKTKKGPQIGTGGHGRKALEPKGPTPKAEDRTYHPTGKAKIRAEKRKQYQKKTVSSSHSSHPHKRSTSSRSHDEGKPEIIFGRNAVVEALQKKVPALTLYCASRIDVDDRIRTIRSLANDQNIPMLEIMRPELDRLTGFEAVHQGVALSVEAYEYAHPMDLFEEAYDRQEVPLLVALDGITDPRNLGAIVRSVAAFGGHGAVITQHRSASMTAAAWKASAGAAAHARVARTTNLTHALIAYKKKGAFVVGLDGQGPAPITQMHSAKQPLILVVGSEGKGLSRLVRETCDEIVSIPIYSEVESLNASVAVSVSLYETMRMRTL